MRLGSKIGKPIKIDDDATDVSRGHFSSICVELDLSKPLVSRFRKVGRFEYEEVHLVYFKCGMYAHRKDTYLMERGVSMAAPENLEENNANGIPAIQVNDQISKEEIR